MARRSTFELAQKLAAEHTLISRCPELNLRRNVRSSSANDRQQLAVRLSVCTMDSFWIVLENAVQF